MQRTTRVAAILLLLTSVPAWAGDIDPPGPPAATRENLIQAADLPLTITSEGTWFLAESITTSGDGIVIAADFVTIDLRGHRLAGGTGDGIRAVGGAIGVEVRNGALIGWAGDGVDLGQAFAARVEAVRARVNGGAGIRVGDGSMVVESLGTLNGGAGIDAGQGSAVLGSIASGNAGAGIQIADASSVIDCVTNDNLGAGITTAGQALVARSSANDNESDGIVVAFGSNVSHSSVASNNGTGIYANAAAQITGTTVRDNLGHGIHVADDALVTGNLTQGNGNGTGAGIYLPVGSGSRIERNNVFANLLNGIEVHGDDNFITGNTASGNTGVDYYIDGTNAEGQVINGVGGMTIGTTTPWANWEY